MTNPRTEMQRKEKVCESKILEHNWEQDKANIQGKKTRN